MHAALAHELKHLPEHVVGFRDDEHLRVFLGVGEERVASVLRFDVREAGVGGSVKQGEELGNREAQHAEVLGGDAPQVRRAEVRD